MSTSSTWFTKAVATITSINATMLVGARTNYALAGDWAALRLMARWNEARGVPARAFLLQGAIALGLVAFGAAQKDGFEAMVEFGDHQQNLARRIRIADLPVHRQPFRNRREYCSQRISIRRSR